MTEELSQRSIERYKRPLLYVMGPLYIVAGILHFVAPDAYERVVPPQFPRPRELVYLSGIAEIVLGIGVLVPSTRRGSAWGLVALLAAVFPANVYMARDDVAAEVAPEWATDIARVAAWLRLPLQAVLALWAWWYTLPAEES